MCRPGWAECGPGSDQNVLADPARRGWAGPVWAWPDRMISYFASNPFLILLARFFPLFETL